jgi:hypothetical protein
MTQYVVFAIDLVPKQAGTFVVPPFPVWTGTKEQQTRELRLEVRRDAVDSPRAWLDVAVEPVRVYVHEPIRVHFDAGVLMHIRLDQGRANNGIVYYDCEVQADWLTAFPGGESIEMPPPARTTAWMVQGNLAVPVIGEEDHERDGERWRRFRFDRAFLPTRPGKVELAAPRFRYNVVKQRGRDVFGAPRHTAEAMYVYGKPVTLEVLPIPEAGRPTPYYGAVGRFTIDASLDRDSVRRGGSVKLSLTVRGQGNFEFLRLPALDDLKGLHKLGQAEAQRDAGKVVVTYDLSPLSTDVKEVPAIAWNFFDTTPGVEAFVAVATKPVPLQVLEIANAESLAPLPESAPKAVTPGVDDIFDLPDLGGGAVVARTVPGWTGYVVAFAPWLVVVGLASLLRRRRALAADVVGQRARGANRTFAQALRQGSEPLEALAAYLGDRLGLPAAAVIAPDLRQRLQAANVPAELAAAVVDAIDRGTAARYGGGGELAAEDAKALVRQLDGERFGVRALLPFLLPFLLVANLGARLHAQGPATDAVAAYRAGDYQAAEAGFAAAYAATGDRRLLQARGNCLFRLGDLPRALWAYESARLGLPHDAELAANVALVRTRLELPTATPGLLGEVDSLRARLSPLEQALLGGACMLVAAACLVFGWRRAGLRWLGGLALLPGGWLSVVLLDTAGQPPPMAIAREKLALVAEPRTGLVPIATVRDGVAVELLGGGDGTFVRIRVGDRSGYAPRSSVLIVE